LTLHGSKTTVFKLTLKVCNLSVRRIETTGKILAHLEFIWALNEVLLIHAK